MKMILLLLVTFTLSGCFHWVTNGGNGMAEAYEVANDQSTELYQQNARQLIEYQFQLHGLVQQGGLEIAPAALHVARMQWVRATREHSNGLNQSAHQNLLSLQSSIEKIRKKISKNRPSIYQDHEGVSL